MFGDRKIKDEPGFETQDPNYEIDLAMQDFVVKSIFRKAQTEQRTNVNFFATLCLNITRLELQMKGLAPTKANAK